GKPGEKAAHGEQGKVRSDLDEAGGDFAERVKENAHRVGKDVGDGGRSRETRMGGASGLRLTDGGDRFARAYRRLPKAEEDARALDFTDTVCGEPALVLPGGQVVVGFNLNDAVPTYQVTVFGHTLDGRLAAATRILEARKPLSLQPIIPDEL